MSLGIAVYVVAGILFVAVGTADAQESMPRPAVVEARATLLAPGGLFRLDCIAGIEGDVGVTVAIAPNIHLGDPNGNIAGRQNSDTSPRDASGSPPAKTSTARRWFSGVMRSTLVFLAGGLAGGR